MKKKIFCMIVLILIVIGSIPVNCKAKQETYMWLKKDATVYSKKSVKSYDVLSLKKGFKLILLDKGNDGWSYVRIMNDGSKGYVKTNLLSKKYVATKTKIDMDKTLDAVRKEVLKTCKDTKVWEKPSENYFMWAVPASFSKKQIIKELSGQFKAEYKLFDMEYFNIEFIGTSYEEHAMIGFEKYKNCDYYNFICYRASKNYHCPVFSLDGDGKYRITTAEEWENNATFVIDYGRDFVIAGSYGWKYVYDPSIGDCFNYEVTRMSDKEYQEFINDHMEKGDLKILNYLN